MTWMTKDEIIDLALAGWDGQTLTEFARIVVRITATECQDIACIFDNAEKISNTIDEIYLQD